MKRILVTGADGQLGMSLRRIASELNELNFQFTDVGELDITDEPGIKKICDEFHPDCIINCAAYTAVDRAEEDQDAAFLINGTAVGNLARVARDKDILLIHISTDYIFSGEHFRAITEEVRPDPQSVYARSKFAGEEEIRQAEGKAFIIRTSWLYSEFGKNFAKTIFRKAKEENELRVIFDQTGTPTYAGDLAKFIITLITGAVKPKGTEILHFANEGTASWYDFAFAIISLAGIDCKITPVRTEEYPLPAKRPFFSVLDKTKARVKYGVEIPHWYESLGKWFENLEKQ